MEILGENLGGNKIISSLLGDGSTPQDYLLLQQLAKKLSKNNALKYLEFGSWRGESVLNVSIYAEKCVCLTFGEDDLRKWALSFFSRQDSIDAVVAENRVVSTANFFSKNLSNVEFIYGDSMSYDYATIKDRFDLIFVDASHHYENVRNDTRRAFELLRDLENSIIVFHDYCRTPEVLNEEVFYGIEEGCPDKYKTRLFHVSNTLCAVYYPFPISSVPMPPFPDMPKYSFSIDICVEKNA